MSKLPVVSGKKTIKALQKIGYQIARQKGSHVRLRDDKDPNHIPITIPLHSELKPGLLRRIIKDSGLSVYQFIELL